MSSGQYYIEVLIPWLTHGWCQRRKNRETEIGLHIDWHELSWSFLNSIYIKWLTFDVYVFFVIFWWRRSGAMVIFSCIYKHSYEYWIVIIIFLVSAKQQRAHSHFVIKKRKIYLEKRESRKFVLFEIFYSVNFQIVNFYVYE